MRCLLLVVLLLHSQIQVLATQCLHHCGDFDYDERMWKLRWILEDLYGDVHRTKVKHLFNAVSSKTNNDHTWFRFYFKEPEMPMLAVGWPPLHTQSYFWTFDSYCARKSDREGYRDKLWFLNQEYNEQNQSWFDVAQIRRHTYDDDFRFTFSNVQSLKTAYAFFRQEIDSCIQGYMDFLACSIQLCQQKMEKIKSAIQTKGDAYYDHDCYDYCLRSDSLRNAQGDIVLLNELIEALMNQRKVIMKLIDSAWEKSEKIYFTVLNDCIQNHQALKAIYDRGLLFFNRGEFHESLEDILRLLDRIKENGNESDLLENSYFQKGQAETELGLYHDAITSFSQALERNPQNREIYLERGIAYFETGQFDEALSDYLASGEQEKQSQGAPISMAFATGLANGIKKGIAEEFGEMAPAWAPIASIGIWAISNNNHPSIKVVTAVLGCVAAAGAYLAADQMITELRELVTNWKSLSEQQQGELTGYVIGKYGIEIFACYGVGKVMDSYQKLKRANSALTFDVMLRDPAAAAAIRARYRSIDKFRADQEFIKKTFGKRAYPEQEIRSFIAGRGYQLPERPKGIPENYFTRFSDKGCGISYHDPAKPEYNNVRIMPGKPHSPNPAQQTPYVIQMRDGRVLNIIGEPVPSKSTAAHIPVEKYVYQSE